MDELVNFLPAILAHAGDQEEVREQAAFAAWVRAVGPVTATRCVPFRLNRKRLVVLTPSLVWKTELQKMSDEMVFQINRILGSPIVSEIEYRLSSNLAASEASQPPENRFENLDDIIESLRPAAAQIQDPEMRAAFLRAAGKAIARTTFECMRTQIGTR